MKVDLKSKQGIWNEFALMLPWVAGLVTFLNAILAIKMALLNIMGLVVVLYIIKRFIEKRPLWLLLVGLALWGLSAGVLNAAMATGGETLRAPWGPSIYVSTLATLQLLDVGNWPVLKPLGALVYHSILFFAGLETTLMSPWVGTLILVVIAGLLRWGLHDVGLEKWDGCTIILPLYYGVVYGVPVTDSLSLFFAYAVVAKVLQKDRSTMGVHMAGFWALFMSFILVVMTLGLQAVLPFDKFENKIQGSLPDLLKSREYKNAQGVRDAFDWSETPYYPLKTRLGGPIHDLGNKVVLKVEAAESPLYLRGAVRTLYDGQTWSNHSASVSRGQLKSDSSYHIDGSADENKVPMKTMMHLDIEEVGSPTGLLFSPLGFWKTDRGLFVETVGEGVHRQKASWLHKPLKKYSIEYTGVDETLLDRNSYLDLPDLPKVKKLVQSITVGAKTDEDRVNRIQAFLKANYKYNLQVPVPPVNQDFVSYFLFENRQGYCTYFASAMTVMVREAGVPARYVEGYLLSPLKYQQGSFYITEDLAHAWTEVYLPKKGWTTVESTPTYDFTRQNREQMDGAEQKPLVAPALTAVKATALKNTVASNQSKVWQLVVVGLLLTLFILYLVTKLLVDRWFYRDQTRRGFLRRLYYYEFILEMSFEGSWGGIGIPRKMSRYFLIETSSSLLVFDDIIKTAERILYDSKMPNATELSRLNEFIQLFERHYLGKMTRIITMLKFLKGWTKVGADGKGTTS